MDNFDSPVKHYDQVEDAVTVLRKTLASSEVDTMKGRIVCLFL